MASVIPYGSEMVTMWPAGPCGLRTLTRACAVLRSSVPSAADRRVWILWGVEECRLPKTNILIILPKINHIGGLPKEPSQWGLLSVKSSTTATVTNLAVIFYRSGQAHSASTQSPCPPTGFPLAAAPLCYSSARFLSSSFSSSYSPSLTAQRTLSVSRSCVAASSR